MSTTNFSNHNSCTQVNVPLTHLRTKVPVLLGYCGTDFPLNQSTPYNLKLLSLVNEITLLAKMPSYDEWQQLHKFLEEFNTLEVAKENQQLKELLKECEEVLLSYSNINGDYELYDKITNAIGEKK